MHSSERSIEMLGHIYIQFRPLCTHNIPKAHKTLENDRVDHTTFAPLVLAHHKLSFILYEIWLNSSSFRVFSAYLHVFLWDICRLGFCSFLRYNGRVPIVWTVDYALVHHILTKYQSKEEKLSHISYRMS